MKSFFILIIFLCLPLHSNAQNENINSLYRQLDDAVANSAVFVKQREKRIATLKNSLQQTKNTESIYQLNFRLFEEYRSFINDSAIAYIKRCIDISHNAGDKHRETYCMILIAHQLTTGGMYFEASEILDKMNKSMLGKRELGIYYKTKNYLYNELGYHSNIPEVQKQYYRQASIYSDSMYCQVDRHSTDYLEVKERTLIYNNQYAEALHINNQLLGMAKPLSHKYAIAAYYRQLIYEHMGNTEKMKYWLAKSAICDIRNAIMDQASLWTLARQLDKEGDIDRSYRYINYAWNAANFFGTRIRNWQISPIVHYISKDYQKIIRSKNRILSIFTVTVSLMSVLLLFLLYYVNKQRKHLVMARNTLKEANESLEQLNRKLSESNRKLDATNHKLSDTNHKLNESNRVKEAYIGRFIGMCSLYIDKMDDLRRQINRMMLNRQYEKVMQITKSADIKNKEIDELYVNFDAVFITLFPNFVNDFNVLLKPKDRIHLSNPNKLTTPIRVFALIRLGIDDSTKIAEFLHYSVNTIYNYRAKIKNSAIGDRNMFEKQIKELGNIKDTETTQVL
ncbi:DUF6377 domain-containing protein [Hoylesella oralis]|uniref:DUF6377 domain-containing protein n=1 Tax=Hoylesella oralis TaxID=28134 RepID=UPI0028ED7EB8|nr:DUF6377 domain-containing protein [Hoylesella oralis]